MQVFALCKHFEDLSLHDSSSSSLVKRSTYGDCIHRFISSLGDSASWIRAINANLRAPFMELPGHYLKLGDYLQPHSTEPVRMCFGFRFDDHGEGAFDNGQGAFLEQELRLPDTFQRLSFIRQSLGLIYNRASLRAKTLFELSRTDVGFRSLVSEKNLNKILIEVITEYNGKFGRFLVYVCLGVGCTVWYGMIPSVGDHLPEDLLLETFRSYEQFFKPETVTPILPQKVHFLEGKDVSSTLASAFRNEQPFADITIPANGPVLTAVSLGIMVAICIAVGIVPNEMPL